VQNNNYAGFYQFPINICGQYRFALISELTLTGPESKLSQLEFFLDQARARGSTEFIYLNQEPMPHDDALCWPATGLTTWCLHPAAPNNHDRPDLVAAPPGFILAGRGSFRPVYLHHTYRHTQQEVGGIHLVGGVLEHRLQELTSGGVEVSFGSFMTIELELTNNGELHYETTSWQLHKLGDKEVTRDV
jgi:hypothetical protein